MKLAFIILFLSSFVASTTIYGTVYDLQLSEVKQVVLEINSTPSQKFVSLNGSYEFQVTKGDFKITASKNNVSAESETISIIEEGKYKIDLILLSFDVDTSLEPIDDEIDLTEDEASAFETQTQFPTTLVVVAVFVCGLIFLVFWTRKESKTPKNASFQEPPRKEEKLNEVQKDLVEKIRQNGGIINQVELRKKVPYSEARVSMELDVLEQKGVLKKFKKGRGNIVELQEGEGK